MPAHKERIGKAMSDDKERIMATINRLAGAVVGAIREGTADDRARLAGELKIMEAGIPGEAGDAAEAKTFLAALTGLLEGRPIDTEGLAEPYAGMYERIAKAALDARSVTHGGANDEMKDFLTQLAASVVLMMRKGTEDEKKGLAAKLLEIIGGMPKDQEGAIGLVTALVAILEGRPSDPDTLPAPYSSFLKKVKQSISYTKGKP
jgi:hypothetical protein